MPRINIIDIQNFTNTLSSANTLNSNNAVIEAAFDKCLFKDGTQPNAMEAHLDMNGKRISNLAAPTTGSDAARLTDVQDATSGTAVTAVEVSISDSAAIITATNVEGALAENRTAIDVIEADYHKSGDTVDLATFTLTGSVAEFNAALQSNSFVTLTGSESLSNKTLAGTLSCADQILDRPVLKDYGETINALGDLAGGTDEISLVSGNVVTATVSTSTETFTFANPPASGTAGSFTLFLTNGGSQTVNWPASVDWPEGSAPSLTTSGIDVLTFTTLDGGTIWYGFLAGSDMK